MQRIELDPLVVTVRPEAKRRAEDVTDKGEGALFEDGTRLFKDGEHAQAILHFDRLVQLYPESTNWASALWNSALAHGRLKSWGEALARFQRYLDNRAALRAREGKPARGADEVDGEFQAALCEHELGRVREAIARLQRLAADAAVPPVRRAEARVQEAVCRIETSDGRAEAEKLLRSALATYEKEGGAEALDPSLFAQAEFWLGELYRSWFREQLLDAATAKQKELGEKLETKAQFLLSAQGHYLRAIRRGDGEWATSSGFRIGELYEIFYRDLVDAPVPKDLSARAQQVYRDELKKKVRVLIEKAIRVYEQTLAAAVRVGAQNSYVQQTGEALDRLRALLAPPAVQ